MSFNRIANVGNRFQGPFKRVLCLCSAGLLRSPTTAFILSNTPYNYNTRAAGVNEEYALIPVDEVMVEWADEIIVMEKSHKIQLMYRFPDLKKPIHCLDIPDNFEYRNPKLMKMIKTKYNAILESQKVKDDDDSEA